MNTENKIIINLKKILKNVRTNLTNTIKQQIMPKEIIRIIKKVIIETSTNIIEQIKEIDNVGIEKYENESINKMEQLKIANKNKLRPSGETNTPIIERVVYGKIGRPHEPDKVSKTTKMYELKNNSKDRFSYTTRDIIFAESYIQKKLYIYYKRSLYVLNTKSNSLLNLFKRNYYDVLNNKRTSDLTSSIIYSLDKLKKITIKKEQNFNSNDINSCNVNNRESKVSDNTSGKLYKLNDFNNYALIYH